MMFLWLLCSEVTQCRQKKLKITLFKQVNVALIEIYIILCWRYYDVYLTEVTKDLSSDTSCTEKILTYELDEKTKTYL